MARFAAVLGAVAALALLVTGVWWHCLKEWTAWHDFASSYIQQNGRVIDFAARDRSTSEGQAYALFFALVADDKPRFEKLLRWTEDNLAQGNLEANLPAWLWGLAEDGSWGVIDSNPASDADLWLAYALLEAGRLWQRPKYINQADALLAQIRAREVETLPGAGAMILPAPHGFRPEEGAWRLNPSYLPDFLLERLAQHQPNGPWAEIRNTANNLLKQAAPLGLVPDWYLYTAAGGVEEDTQTGPVGGYEAIRVYMWKGLWPAHSDWTAVRGLADVIAQAGYIPERINTRTGDPQSKAPSGFTGTLLPYWQGLKDKKMYQDLAAGYLGNATHAKAPSDYYGRVLFLFGAGWHNNRFRIDEQGRTVPRWHQSCCGLLH